MTCTDLECPKAHNLIRGTVELAFVFMFLCLQLITLPVSYLNITVISIDRLIFCFQFTNNSFILFTQIFVRNAEFWKNICYRIMFTIGCCDVIQLLLSVIQLLCGILLIPLGGILLKVSFMILIFLWQKFCAYSHLYVIYKIIILKQCFNSNFDYDF